MDPTPPRPWQGGGSPACPHTCPAGRPVHSHTEACGAGLTGKFPSVLEKLSRSHWLGLRPSRKQPPSSRQPLHLREGGWEAQRQLLCQGLCGPPALVSGSPAALLGGSAGSHCCTPDPQETPPAPWSALLWGTLPLATSITASLLLCPVCAIPPGQGRPGQTETPQGAWGSARGVMVRARARAKLEADARGSTNITVRKAPL